MIRKYLSLLQQTTLFQGMSDLELETILHVQNPLLRQYNQEDYLFHSGDSVRYLGIVLEGSVTVLQEDFWGNRNIVAKLGRGDLFAEAYACSPEHRMGVSVMTDTGATILYLDTQTVLSPPHGGTPANDLLIRNLITTLSRKNILLNTKLRHLSQRSTREKLLSYLSEISTQVHQSSFKIPFDRQQLADYLSVNRSALSKELSKLREEGLLTYHKNQFTLLE